MKSKGEIVTDHFSDDPSLNIVQYDPNCEVIANKKFTYRQKTVTATNAYEYKSKYYADEIQVELQYIKYQFAYCLIGKYKLIDVCTQWYGGEGIYVDCEPYGNPVVLHSKKEKKIETEEELEEFMHPTTTDPSQIKGNTMETYCWVIVGVFHNQEDMNLAELADISDEMFEILLCDLPGC